MADKCNCCSNSAIKDKVCIHTDKVYDSCREKDCLEDLRVYLTREGQEVADRAISVRIKGAEIVWVYSDVEPVAFNKSLGIFKYPNLVLVVLSAPLPFTPEEATTFPVV